MTRRLQDRYPGPGGMFGLSFVLHLVIFLIIVRTQLLPQLHQEEPPATYVDMVTLPVASPQSGTPAPAPMQAPPAPAATAAPPPPPAAAPKPEMALPAAKPKIKAKTPPAKAKAEKPAPPAPASEAREFNERLAKLERQAEEKRQAEVLEKLRGKARTGMPGGKGTEAGSDYSSYLQSRLKDAFREVVMSQSKSPQVIATITIGADGKVAEYHVDKSSGDPLFEDAVARAVTIAGRSLKPPPTGVQFKRVFRFRPEGVGVR